MGAGRCQLSPVSGEWAKIHLGGVLSSRLLVGGEEGAVGFSAVDMRIGWLVGWLVRIRIDVLCAVMHTERCVAGFRFGFALS